VLFASSADAGKTLALESTVARVRLGYFMHFIEQKPAPNQYVAKSLFSAPGNTERLLPYIGVTDDGGRRRG
jgi:hypothetical protein